MKRSILIFIFIACLFLPFSGRANPGIPEWWGAFFLLDGTEPDAWQEMLADHGNLITVGTQNGYTLYYWVCHVPTLPRRINLKNLYDIITSQSQYKGRTYLEMYQTFPALAKRVLLCWDETQGIWISVYQHEQLYGSAPPPAEWRRPIIISGWKDEM